MTKNLLKVRYESNNSGGYWWLKDKDWENLEKASWKVRWFIPKNCYLCKGTGIDHTMDHLYHTKKGRKCISQFHSKDGRFLGALANEAEKDGFKNVGEAIKEFERITKQDVSDEGCKCCGAPHTFWFGKIDCFDWKCKHEVDDKNHFWDSCSGEECLKYMFPNRKIPKNLREAMESKLSLSEKSCAGDDSK